ncbi:hypothetical protein [Lentzea sp. CA-135723]|uniref:hypothetical protein n=1 Tax=Lentzea sp. CA-135723 TaxID=3239950 RepID=UPI003D8B6AFA
MSGQPADSSNRNPFSPMAVARLGGFGEEAPADVTVQTDAVRQATSYLDTYLEAPASRVDNRPPGSVLAIIGEYGTGKTHLARHLLRHVATTVDDPLRAMHIEATGVDLFESYQRFTNGLDLDRVRKRVSDFYADVVAEELQDTGLAHRAADLLRDRKVEPHKVVEQLHLMESALLRRVRQKLLDVTENESFGIALTLLLRPGFDRAVWSWLTGAKPEPDPILVERDITRPIASDVDVLEAMGVFALLFGGEERRFLLVIDEFDKILWADRPDNGPVLRAFQRMLEIFTNAGAFLVLCGHPDFLELIDDSVKQRITYLIKTAGMSTAQVTTFIEEVQEAELRVRRLAPFTPETVRYIVALTSGYARKVIRMCHGLYHLVREREYAYVTVDLVHEVARNQLGALSSDEIVSLARQVLVANGWPYQHGYHLSADPDSRADFWVSSVDSDGGCAVLFTESVLTATDLAAVLRRVAAVRDANGGTEVVLVVNGVVEEGFADDLRTGLGTEPLAYTERGFTEDFRALVAAVTRQVPAEAGDDPVGAVNHRIDQVARQQSSIYEFLEQLAGHVDGLRLSSDRQFSTLQHQLGSIVQEQQRLRTESEGEPVPSEVDVLFLDAIAVLEELTQIDLMLRDAFDPEQRNVLDAVQRRLRSSPAYFEAVGIAAHLTVAVTSFRDRVAEWLRSDEVARSRGALSLTAENTLDQICQSYDDVTEYLPSFKFDPLVQLVPWTARGGTLADLGKTSRRARLSAALDNLSPRVRRAAMRSLLGSGT